MKQKNVKSPQSGEFRTHLQKQSSPTAFCRRGLFYLERCRKRQPRYTAKCLLREKLLAILNDDALEVS